MNLSCVLSNVILGNFSVEIDLNCFLGVDLDLNMSLYGRLARQNLMERSMIILQDKIVSV